MYKYYILIILPCISWESLAEGQKNEKIESHLYVLLIVSGSRSMWRAGRAWLRAVPLGVLTELLIIYRTKYSITGV